VWNSELSLSNDVDDHELQTSPQIYARTGGVLYLIIIVIGIFGEAFIRDRLVVPGDPAATAERIGASEFLWRVGIAGELVLLICAVALVLIFYVLLRPVSRELALLAVFFNLVSLARSRQHAVPRGDTVSGRECKLPEGC
jgi:hypothetical protein